jgi:hypothetical protein
MRSLCLSTSLLAIVTACGASNPLDPGAGNNVGTGTGTLLVNGSAIAEANVPNAKLDTDFVTHVDLQLSLNGAAVTTGTVTIKSRTGTLALVYNGGQGNLGHWSGQIANYDEVYNLDVTSGPDAIHGVYIDGPDIHTFTAPTLGATLDATMANTLTWARGAAAEEARFTAGDGGGLVIADSGTYSIPPGTLKSNRGQAQTNTLRLTRTNGVVPKGAVAGSKVSVGVANQLDVVAMPCTGVGC